MTPQCKAPLATVRNGFEYTSCRTFSMAGYDAVRPPPFGIEGDS
jgi:hypothetical protein